MRVNIYAEELTERIEIISKEIEGQTFTGLRLYLELPVTVKQGTIENDHIRGPFLHRPGDDDSAAITFWGKRDLRHILLIAIRELTEHYQNKFPADYITCPQCASKAMYICTKDHS